MWKGFNAFFRHKVINSHCERRFAHFAHWLVRLATC